MHKKPKYPVSYAPIELDEEFPFAVSDLYVQLDRTITCLHRHDVPELGYCCEGNGIFVVGNKVMSFKAGDIVVIAPREFHLAQSVKGTVSKWHWVYFDPPRLLFSSGEPILSNFSRFQGEHFSNIIAAEAQPELCRLVKALVENGLDVRPFRRERLLALLTLFIAELHTAFAALPKTPEDFDVPQPESLWRLNAALQYLSGHYREPLPIARLAKLCCLSVTHFRRLFRQATGKTPLEYLHRIRIVMAMAELRRGEASIGEIALACGFDSLSSFNRRFKHVTGEAPRDWRRRNG